MTKATQSVSVIIPTNRVDQWFQQAVKSVLASENVTVEVVLVFDGVVPPRDEDWIDDDRIKVLRNQVSQGPAGAMHSGVNASSHEFISRLDSDDLIRPDRLVKQADYLAQHPGTVAVGSRMARIDEHGVSSGAVKGISGDDIRSSLLTWNSVGHSTLMFRRAVHDEIGGYDTRLHQMEDYVFILELAQRGPVAILDDYLVSYRVHRMQTSRGAAASGAYIDRVLAERKKLAHVIGVGSFGVSARNALWLTVQYLRMLGVLRPGFTY